MSLIFFARIVLAVSSSASGNSRSARTLSVPRPLVLRAMSSAPVILTIAFQKTLQPALDQSHVHPRRLDPRFRLLLEGVQHMNAVGDPNRVDGTPGVAAMVLDQLVDTRSQALPWLCRRRRAAQL